VILAAGCCSKGDGVPAWGGRCFSKAVDQRRGQGGNFKGGGKPRPTFYGWSGEACNYSESIRFMRSSLLFIFSIFH
jgi:hypothetical protein